MDLNSGFSDQIRTRQTPNPRFFHTQSQPQNLLFQQQKILGTAHPPPYMGTPIGTTPVQRPPSNPTRPPIASQHRVHGASGSSQSSSSTTNKTPGYLEDPITRSKRLIVDDLRPSMVRVQESYVRLIENRANITPELVQGHYEAYNSFQALCDQIDRSLTTTLETSKTMTKMEHVYAFEGAEPKTNPPRGNANFDQIERYIADTNRVANAITSTTDELAALSRKLRRHEKEAREDEELWKNRRKLKDEILENAEGETPSTEAASIGSSVRTSVETGNEEETMEDK